MRPQQIQTVFGEENTVLQFVLFALQHFGQKIELMLICN